MQEDKLHINDKQATKSNDSYVTTDSEHLKLGKSGEEEANFRSAYKNAIDVGLEPTSASTYAGHFVAQLKKGEHRDWAYGYAVMRAHGRDDVFASVFAKHFVVQLQKGKHRYWAYAYALMKAQGEDDTYASLYAQKALQIITLDANKNGNLDTYNAREKLKKNGSQTQKK